MVSGTITLAAVPLGAVGRGVGPLGSSLFVRRIPRVPNRIEIWEVWGPGRQSFACWGPCVVGSGALDALVPVYCGHH